MDERAGRADPGHGLLAGDGRFDPACRRCERLAGFLADCRREHPDYFAAPVPPFGDPAPRILIVGLAPGMHGANRTGRPFTGDHAGLLLYRTLHELGLSSGPESLAADDLLELRGVRITNAVKCLPPANKPTPAEARTCNAFLRQEIAALPTLRVIVALGRLAHDAVLDAVELRRAALRFAHGAENPLGRGVTLLDSYHCSRYNTQTRRLTAAMFLAVLARAAALAG
jgi:uracil-DNA glycosylase family 4